MQNPGTNGKTSIFVFSDHEEAKSTVRGLAEDLGFESVNGGRLANSLYGEAMGALIGYLAIECGYRDTMSFRFFSTEG
jgi:predicted dinucleotide-binding enzyme